jgi:rare lipoprotein A
MKQYILAIVLLLFTPQILQKHRTGPKLGNTPVMQVVQASYYGHGDGFDGKRTASGERFNKMRHTAAHKWLPFGTRVFLLNRETKKWTIVTINDRGPFVKGRDFDISWIAAKDLQMVDQGVAALSYRIL